MNHPTPTLPPVVTCRAVTAIALLVAVLLAVPTSAQTRVRSTDRTTAGLVVAAVGTGLMPRSIEPSSSACGTISRPLITSHAARRTAEPSERSSGA